MIDLKIDLLLPIPDCTTRQIKIDPGPQNRIYLENEIKSFIRYTTH